MLVPSVVQKYWWRKANGLCTIIRIPIQVRVQDLLLAEQQHHLPRVLGKMDDEPVLTTGAGEAWDRAFVSPTDVIKVDGMFYLYYSGGTGYVPVQGRQHHHQLGLASSSDGIHFEKYDDVSTIAPNFMISDPVLPVGEAGSYDSGLAWEATVLPTSFGFKMYYTSDPDSWTGERISYATSENGIYWSKYLANPVFDDLQSWITHDLVVGSVLKVGEQYRIYYSGISGLTEISIGLATGIKE